MSTYHSLVVTSQDFDRVQDAMSTASGFDVDRLDSELARAQIIDQKEAPRSLVTMNSLVTYQDVKSGKRHTVRLVYPRDANVSKSQISVFAPLGSALLGLREGQEIDWTMPGGPRRIKVVEVVYQPEAAGDWNL
jgi:regulator of nucleoside diphosphate kinase